MCTNFFGLKSVFLCSKCDFRSKNTKKRKKFFFIFSENFRFFKNLTRVPPCYIENFSKKSRNFFLRFSVLFDRKSHLEYRKILFRSKKFVHTLRFHLPKGQRWLKIFFFCKPCCFSRFWRFLPKISKCPRGVLIEIHNFLTWIFENSPGKIFLDKVLAGQKNPPIPRFSFIRPLTLCGF